LALECGRALLEHGLAGLAILDLPRSLDSSQKAIDTLQNDFRSNKILATPVDVTDATSVAGAVSAVAGLLGNIDMLCHFAGVVDATHALDMSPEQWRRTLDINTTGAFICAQAVAKKMITQKTRCSITFISSISAQRVNYPQPQAGYNVSKAGLVHLARCLAAEWTGYGIRVNTISPGYMDTILNEGEGLEEARKIWMERNPMRRMGTPRELTGPLVLLCSDAGSYINGTDLVVDGGSTVF